MMSISIRAWDIMRVLEKNGLPLDKIDFVLGELFGEYEPGVDSELMRGINIEDLITTLSDKILEDAEKKNLLHIDLMA